MRELPREDQEDVAQDALVDLVEERTRSAVRRTLGFLTTAVGWRAMNASRRLRRRRTVSVHVEDLDGLAGPGEPVPEASVHRVLEAMPARLLARLERIWHEDGGAGTRRVWRTRIRR